MGGGVPSPNNGRSEYLVDTESNTIIYPKTRIEDIIGLENLDIPNKPGSDDSEYVYYEESKLISLTTQNGVWTNLYRIKLEEPGLYYLYGSMDSSNNISPQLPGDLGDHRLALNNFTDNVVIAMTSMWLYRGGSGGGNISSVYKITKPTDIEFQCRIVQGTTFKQAGIIIRYCKLK